MDSSNNSSLRRKGKGRQKITMEKIKNATSRQVTFSKRRAGLFKKASELSTLCGAESAIVVFSHSQKAHSFGAPNVETITNRFLNQIALGTTENTQIETPTNRITRLRNQELTILERKLELEKKHKKEHNMMRKTTQSQKGYPPNLGELNYMQLNELKKSILLFKHDLETKIKNAMDSGANSYVEGPDPDTQLAGELPMTTSAGLNIDFSLDRNIQGDNYLGDGYGDASLALDIEASSNVCVGFPNKPRASDPSATFFRDMITTSNHEFVDPMVGNFDLPFTYPHHEANGSSFMFPYNYGYGQDNSQGFNNNYGYGN